MTHSAAAREILTISTVATPVREPDAELLALLLGTAPLTSAQWKWVQKIEQATALI